MDPLTSEIPATQPDQESYASKQVADVSGQKLAGQKEQFSKMLSVKPQSKKEGERKKQADSDNDPLQSRYVKTQGKKEGERKKRTDSDNDPFQSRYVKTQGEERKDSQTKITERKTEQDRAEEDQNDTVQNQILAETTIARVPQENSISGSNQVEQHLATDNVKHSQVLEQMRVACERIAVSQDKTAVHVQLNSQVLTNCSMTVTKAEDGTLAFVFNTQASDSADFLRRNTNALTKAVQNEIDAQVDIKVVHSDAEQSQQYESSPRQQQREEDEFA